MKLPKPKEGGSFELCPPGNHVAICYGVVDIGTQERQYRDGPKMERRVRIMWEIPEEQMSDGRPFAVNREYKLSGHEKSNLRKHLDSWRGKKFSDEDFEKFDMKMLLGKGCMLQVVHNESGDRTYANIETVGSLPKGMKVGETTNEHVYVSLDQEDYDPAAFDMLHEKTQEYIKESPEWQALNADAGKNIVNTPYGSYDDAEDDQPF